ncbi:MAG: ORF6N domain-containing protein [Planctomycetota bacterium]
MKFLSRAAALVPVERVERAIYFIRGRKAMLDVDLATFYGVTTKALNQAVKRNQGRFPADFMFQLTGQEANSLRSQIVTSNVGRGGRRYRPHAFTEHGAVMLASVLNSPMAVRASLVVVRAFVRMREVLSSNRDLARKLAALEGKCDARFRIVFDAIRGLMSPPAEAPKPRIGFRS